MFTQATLTHIAYALKIVIIKNKRCRFAFIKVYDNHLWQIHLQNVVTEAG